ncbi:transcriptional regulator, TetR family [Gracilibacillus ureilyticus]|uniref:Transcriptional regulator, TetR family n=1 Tax=Gracilibacillus ureilyticus TaxID=531814 RepID=A0A1H9NJZ8_9BACI|nr:TetR/AcrR family transcriptional regulator [Gracilibacillus ureilyticus]SER36221.1 transcriptional regulator, TetR family [Gracilibacillus ureilyticus]
MHKKTEITKAALELFAEQGFNETSVQEIADAVQISKGSFYKYFSSKLALMLDLIEKYHYKIIERMNEFDWSRKTSKHSLAIYIELEINAWIEHQSFFHVLFKEFPPKTNLEITERIEKLHQTTVNNHREIFSHIYGDKLENYVSDLVLLLEGMMRESIFQLIIHKQTDIPSASIAKWISHHLHSVIQHIDEEEPLIQYRKQESIPELLQDIKELIKRIGNSSEKTKYNETISLIESEWKKKDLNLTLIEALLHFLKQNKDLKIKIWQLEQLLLQGERL